MAGRKINLKKKKKKALIFFRNNQLEKARRLFSEICQLSAADIESWFKLGNINERLGNYSEAVQCCRKVVELMPDSAEAHYNLAIGLQRLGRYDEAVNAHRRALQIRHNFIESRINLSLALLELGNQNEAGEHLRQALRIRPGMKDALFLLAVVLDAQGAFDEALATLDQLLQSDPGNQDAQGEKARIFEKQGNFDAAYECLRPLLESGSHNTRVVAAFASLSRHINQSTEAVQFIERALEQNQKPGPETASLHFSAGKLYDEFEQYDLAFKHFRKANALTPYHYNENTHRELVDRLISTYSPEALARLPRATNQSERPLFIVGMPRSGTSLVEQILASHPEIHGAGELTDVTEIAESLRNRIGATGTDVHHIQQVTPKILDKYAQTYLDKLAALSSGAARVTDKMPHNLMFLGLIELLFPGARVIHCRRNPLDTCLSIYSQKFNANHAYATDLTALGVSYRQYLHLMQHWRRVLNIPILEIYYEELVDNQEAISHTMIQFCGLEWDTRCLHFHQSGHECTTLSYDQVRKPIYRKSVGRWKNYARHLGPLIEALGDSAKETLPE